MGAKTRIQHINYKGRHQWYVNFPATVAEALELEKGEVVEWTIIDKNIMMMTRAKAVITEDEER